MSDLDERIEMRKKQLLRALELRDEDRENELKSLGLQCGDIHSLEEVWKTAVDSRVIPDRISHYALIGVINTMEPGEINDHIFDKMIYCNIEPQHVANQILGLAYTYYKDIQTRNGQIKALKEAYIGVAKDKRLLEIEKDSIQDKHIRIMNAVDECISKAANRWDRLRLRNKQLEQEISNRQRYRFFERVKAFFRPRLEQPEAEAVEQPEAEAVEEAALFTRQQELGTFIPDQYNLTHAVLTVGDIAKIESTVREIARPRPVDGTTLQIIEMFNEINKNEPIDFHEGIEL